MKAGVSILVIGVALFLSLWVGSATAAAATVTTAADAGPGSLRATIAAAGDGDTIDFDAGLDGQTIALTSGAIAIDKGLTIDGPGAAQLTIDANHSSQIFVVSGAAGDLAISGLTFANGAAPAVGEDSGLGGAIEQGGAGTLKVAECTFTGNTAGGPGNAEEESNQGHGGAISVSSASGSTTIADSTFIANSAGGAGGSGFQSGLGSGGAIWDINPGSLTVTGSTFIENTAGGVGDGEQAGNGAGGAVQKAGGTALIISDSEFIDNTVGGEGGIEQVSGRGHGGAIYVSEPESALTELSITESTFSGNRAGGNGAVGPSSGVGEGGAIEYFNKGSMRVSGSTFEGNVAGGTGSAGGQILFGPPVGSGGGIGGAIFTSQSAALLSLTDSAFESNIAGGDGGGGFGSGFGEGGAVAYKGGRFDDRVAISGSFFGKNVAGGSKGAGNGSGRGVGGAVRSIGGGTSFVVIGSAFEENVAGAGAGGFGGAMDTSTFNLTISGSTFSGNVVGGDGGDGSGGAISAGGIDPEYTSLSITDSTLVGNRAGGGGGKGWGGALEIADSYTAILSSLTIDGNSVGAGGAGAGIYSENADAPDRTAVTAKATIISSNTGSANCDLPLASSSYSLEGPTGETSCGLDLASADPELGPLVDNGGPTKTQALSAGTPAVDAVPASRCPTKVDQRGEPRPDNGKGVCDVGAYELQDPPEAPAITSPAATTFQVGKAGTFTFTATGLPLPDLIETGPLPAGVALKDNGDGTASLAGTPAAGSAGTFAITIRASNGTLPDFDQIFTLTVQPADPVDPGPPRTAPPPQPDPPLPRPPDPPRPGVLVSYRQHGGTGGPRPALVVFEDRAAKATFGGCAAKFTASRTLWRKLRGRLRRADLPAIAGDYPAPRGSADRITHVIKAGGSTVRIALPQMGHEGVVRHLRPLLKVLNRLVSVGKRRMPSSCHGGRASSPY
jgi:hypothetical protein